MKYPEFILAIQNRSLQELSWFNDVPVACTLQEGFNKVDLDSFLQSVQGGLTIAQRENLDESKHWGESHKGNRDFRQWLNYVVIENHDGRLNPYMRAREGAATGETDLHGRGSIAPGGHTDARYIRFDAGSVLQSLHTALLNILQELCEECAFYIDGDRIATHNAEGELIATLRTLHTLGTLHFEGVMFDNSDPVGRLHLAVSWRFKLNAGVSIGQNESGVDFIEPVMVNDLFSTYPNVRFENWSKIFADHLLLNIYPNGVDVLAHWLVGRD